jgi:hypothetical protein
MKYTCQKCDYVIQGMPEVIYDIISHEKSCDPE